MICGLALDREGIIINWLEFNGSDENVVNNMLKYTVPFLNKQNVTMLGT